MPDRPCLPPEGIERVPLPLVQLRPADLRRIHTPEVEACHFGRSGKARFDDPERRFGVFYGGLGLACCVAETILGELCAGRVEPPPLRARDLEGQLVCRVELPEGSALSLVDLSGAGLLRLGADARLSAEADYLASQAWSRALWAHPAQPDGLLYRSRYDADCLCVALYDRARRHRLIVRPEGALLGRPDLPEVLRRYGIDGDDSVAGPVGTSRPDAR